MSYTYREDFVPEAKHPIKCPYPMAAEFIVVHNTANDASALNEITYMKNNNKKVSYHYAIDDKEVVCAVPWNRNAFHAGDGASGQGNRKGIGIEICHSKSGGSRYAQAEENAVEFIAALLMRHGWDIGRVRKHQDFSGKWCPHRILNENRWDSFKQRIKDEMEGLTMSQYEELKKMIETLEKKIVPLGNEPSEWAKDVWAKTKERGLMDGTNPQGPITREQFAIIMQRMGLI